MIFQKKIIIGSIMSFVATAVGVIAVFFPDLFNMQKKKMEALSIELNNQKDFGILSQFLEKRVEDRKLFKLEIALCDGKNLANEGIDIFSEQIGGLIEDNVISPMTGKMAYLASYYDHRDQNECDLTSDGECSANVYAFPETSLLTGNPANTDFGASTLDCAYMPGMVAQIQGYFVFNKTNTVEMYKMRRFVNFTEVPEKDVMLKDY